MPQPASTVLEFQYGGLGDTIHSLLFGKIVQGPGIGGMETPPRPLAGVEIREERIFPFFNDHLATSDSLGRFVLATEDGQHTLRVSKPGFQTLVISNYQTRGDLMSGTTILLGHQCNTAFFEIPNPPQ